MERILEVAKYFYSKNIQLTDKQIQKLVYYAYSWYIVQYNDDPQNINNRLFEQHPEAWVHGPVFRHLYNQMNNNRIILLENLNNINLPDNLKLFLDIIYNVYGKYTGNQLENLTHSELPWIEARRGYCTDERCAEYLSDKTIYNYYKN